MSRHLVNRIEIEERGRGAHREDNDEDVGKAKEERLELSSQRQRDIENDFYAAELRTPSKSSTAWIHRSHPVSSNQNMECSFRVCLEVVLAAVGNF